MKALTDYIVINTKEREIFPPIFGGMSLDSQIAWLLLLKIVV